MIGYIELNFVPAACFAARALVYAFLDCAYCFVLTALILLLRAISYEQESVSDFRFEATEHAIYGLEQQTLGTPRPDSYSGFSAIAISRCWLNPEDCIAPRLSHAF